MGRAGLSSLVVFSAKLIGFVSPLVDFSLLNVVFSTGVHSLRSELCSLYSRTRSYNNVQSSTQAARRRNRPASLQ